MLPPITEDHYGICRREMLAAPSLGSWREALYLRLFNKNKVILAYLRHGIELTINKEWLFESETFALVTYRLLELAMGDALPTVQDKTWQTLREEACCECITLMRQIAASNEVLTDIVLADCVAGSYLPFEDHLVTIGELALLGLLLYHLVDAQKAADDLEEATMN